MSDHAITPGQQTADATLREQLESMLNNGLEVELEPRAYSSEEVLEIVSRLQTLSAQDYQQKLVIGGFTLTPYGEGDDEQACETCMYYVVHRRFCELPELMLPAEEAWSCRLWRI